MLTPHLAFELLASLAAVLTGYAMYRWRLSVRIRELVSGLGPGYFLALTFGSLSGAYAFGTLNLQLSGQPGLGRSIIGGLAGGIAAVEIYKRRRSIKGSTGVAFAIPLCISVMVGRIGCFVTGLEDFTYGTATTLPWGVDFGDGVRRHPVQLYESGTMLLCMLVLFWLFFRRSPFALANAFYIVVAWYAVQRFAWEFLKPHGTLIGPLNIFHALCLVLLAYAVLMMRDYELESP